MYSPAHRWRSAVPGQAGNASCPSKETVCSSKASSDSEPKPAGQQLKDSLLQQRPVSGDSSPKQTETFKIKIEKAIKGINCSSLARRKLYSSLSPRLFLELASQATTAKDFSGSGQPTGPCPAQPCRLAGVHACQLKSNIRKDHTIATKQCGDRRNFFLISDASLLSYLVTLIRNACQRCPFPLYKKSLWSSTDTLENNRNSSKPLNLPKFESKTKLMDHRSPPTNSAKREF